MDNNNTCKQEYVYKYSFGYDEEDNVIYRGVEKLEIKFGTNHIIWVVLNEENVISDELKEIRINKITADLEDMLPVYLYLSRQSGKDSFEKYSFNFFSDQEISDYLRILNCENQMKNLMIKKDSIVSEIRGLEEQGFEYKSQLEKVLKIVQEIENN